MMTGSDGVSFLFPQLFLSQHRLKEINTRDKIDGRGTDTTTLAEYLICVIIWV